MSSAKKPANRPSAPPPQSGLPRIGMVLHRERLYAMIDARQPGAIWFHGPTGAGKTVLLRSYLDRTQDPVVWVTVDDRHRAPDALFAVLSAGAKAFCSGHLPPFSPEHRDEPAIFARDYFARLDQLLPPAYALVIDDAHHLADACAPLLACAVEAFGGRRRFFVASQLMPGAALAPLLARSKLWTIGHKLLAFDDDEAVDLARCLGSEPLSLEDLVEATDGWAAGLMLAMQLGAGDKPFGASNDPLESIRTPLALLIAGQVLGGVSAEDIARLRLFAELPQVPMDLADAAPAWAGACEQLQSLSERGLFVERLAADRHGRPQVEPAASPTGNVARLPTGCWRLHDLFRSALRDPAASGAPDPGLAEDLASQLLAVDRLDLAWQLAARLDPRQLERVVRSHGSRALHDDHLLALLPLTARHADRAAPAIAMWMARALIGNDDAAALRRCEEAFAGYDRSADREGRALSVALALFVLFSTIERVGEMTVWAERFAAQERTATSLDRAEDEAILLSGEVVYDLLVGGRKVDPADAAAMQDRLMALVCAEVLSANETVLAGALLVAAMRRAIRFKEAEFAVLHVDGLASRRRAAPHLRANWYIENGYHFTRVGAYDRARQCFAEAIGIAEANALSQPRIGALIGLVRLDLGIGNLEESRERIGVLEAMGADRLGRQRGWVIHLRARVEALGGQATRARDSLDVAQRLITEAGFPESTRLIIEQDRVQLLYAMGAVDESAELAAAIRARSSASDGRRVTVVHGLLLAHDALSRDPGGAVDLLRTHLPVAAELNLVTTLALIPEAMAELCAEALRHGICADFATRVVEIRGLSAPRFAPASWPWPVRVEVLRPFRITIANEPLVFTGKTQQKPLELLKFLACARDFVAESTSVAAALWPDGDDAAGKKNLEVTVSRLRKLLNDDTLVVVKDGKVALDVRRISSDARELATAIADAEAVAVGGRPKTEVERLGNHLLALFESLPLEQEESTAWREAVRERYRTAFVRAARTLIGYWTGIGEPARAALLIEAALAREPLAENLYRTLMQIHLDAGNSTEAVRVYRQCRQMLSVLIGAQPSPETERLRQSINN